MKKFVRNNFKLFVGIVVGAVMSGISVYAINASGISYKDNKSVSDALDTLYTISSTYKNLQVSSNFAAEDLLLGKTAYNSNGELITGTYSGSSTNDVATYLGGKVNAIFGGKGISFEGFTVGHKYLAVYTSNFWQYGLSTDAYVAYISSGATDIQIVTTLETDERTGGGGRSYGSLFTFTATDTNLTLYYAYGANYYAMKFIDITN